MWLADVNVVVAAFRDDHPGHEVARGWLRHALDADRPVGVPSVVWSSFARVVTNRRIYKRTTPADAAIAFIDAVSDDPGFVVIEPGPLHRRLFAESLVEGGATGDLVPDAYLVAIAREHAAQIVTFDRDFARFPSARHLLLTG